MFRPWTSVLKLSSHDVRLLVTEPATGDLLKARLPIQPRHPRAMLTVLEGIALWQGHPLCVVINADAPSLSLYGSGLFGDELWPAESSLVRFELDARARRAAHRLRGVGDFRALRSVPTGESR